MDFTKTTEQDSHYNHLEQKSIADLLKAINNEDQSVPKAVKKSIATNRNLSQERSPNNCNLAGVCFIWEQEQVVV